MLARGTASRCDFEVSPLGDSVVPRLYQTNVVTTVSKLPEYTALTTRTLSVAEPQRTPLISVLNIISILQHNIFCCVCPISTTGREVYLHARPPQSGTCTSFHRIPQCSLARTPRRIHKLLQMLLFMFFVIPSLELLSNTTPNLSACSYIAFVWQDMRVSCKLRPAAALRS